MLSRRMPSWRNSGDPVAHIRNHAFAIIHAIVFTLKLTLTLAFKLMSVLNPHTHTHTHTLLLTAIANDSLYARICTQVTHFAFCMMGSIASSTHQRLIPVWLLTSGLMQHSNAISMNHALAVMHTILYQPSLSKPDDCCGSPCITC